MIEEINQPIAVIALYDKGTVRPLRFKWGGRVYRVKKVNHTWSQKIGHSPYLHIAVETDGYNTMELVVDPADLSWRLARMSVDG